MELKYRLKSLRAEANLTQEDLANQIFVSRTLVAKWESGERYPSKDNLARLAVLFQIPQEELIGGKREKAKYNIFNTISIIYSSFCNIITLGLIFLFIRFVVEKTTLNNGWTNVGALMICYFVLPVIIVLVLLEAIMLKKKNGYKTLELYSLFGMILSWLLSIAAYIYLI